MTESAHLSSEVSFFSDKDEVCDLISSLCSQNVKDDEKTLQLLEKFLIKYQEQPQLLEPHLVSMIEPINENLLGIVTNEGDIVSGKLNSLCKLLHLLCRVRGFKHVIKHFPHEVHQFEPVLSLLYSESGGDHNNWETRYILLLWLSVLCLIPFDICSIDSNSISKVKMGDVNVSEEKSPLVKQILHICELFLRDSGPTRDAASVCLSSLLTRPDMEAEYLSDYISWTTKMLKEWSNKSEAEKLELSKDSFLIIGVLHSLAHIFKKGHRHKLLPFSIPLMSPILKLAESPATTLVSKLLTKLFQRIGMTFLPPRIANWRYMRGHRLLLQNSLNAAPKKDEESEVEEDNNEVEAQYASEMEEVIEVMIVALQDNDTIVRWSGAKGIGRITMRLSKDLADDVVQAVIDLFADPEADGQWHGGCLALAELSRRGLLLPERLEEVIPIIERAMHFDILRGQHSIGAHVRDAACYVCWAFARAYSPTIMKPYIDQLSAAMLVTAVYDREINCRRAASAAFQETVGRQGSEVIPLGIDIITIADYFSLGIRHNAFLTIAPMVANLDSKIHIRYMSHLKDVKICHWDSDIREVAAKALAAIALIDVPLTVSILKEIISDCLSTNIFIRHGSLLATSELLSVLTIEGVPLSDDLLIDVANIVPQLDKARLYRGRGSDITRQASCILVQSIARANISVPMKLKIALTEIMNENLKQPHEAVQIAAADALRQLLFVCFGKGDAPSDRLSALTVDKYLEGIRSATNVAITRGYAIALGALPVRLATLPVGKFSEILSVLKSASSNTFCVNGEQDADTRRNAVTAIVEITEKSCDAVCFLQEDLQSALQCLFDASNDYAVDKRGDTGSWSRMAALRGMYRIAKKVVGIPAYNFQPIIEPAKVVADFQEGVTNSTYAIMTSYGNTVIKSVVTCGESKLVVTYSIREQDTFAVDVEADQYLVYNLNDHKFLVETRSSCSFCSLSISDESRFQIFQTIFKQLAEKLDAVRDIAGKVLLQFLLAQSCTSSRGRNQDDSVNNFKSYLPIPDYNIVVDSIESVMRDVLISNNTADSIGIEKISEKGNFNYQLIHWAQPEHVFPIVISLLRSKIYFDHIMAGLVVSIGGLTETIAKTSASVLLRYCKVDEATNIEHDRFLERLSACLIQLFVTYSRDDRVTLPLIKTLHVLIRSNVFIFFNHEQLDSFGQKLLSSLSVEMTKCSNLVKLCSAMDLCVLLFNFGRVSRSNTMKTMIKYLLHKYPRVRKHCAELLYLHLLVDSSAVGSRQDIPEGSIGGFVETDAELDELQTVLSTTPWDSQDSTHLKTCRSRILQLLLIELEEKAREPGKKSSSSKVKTDELDSYEALVREAGY